MHRAAVRPVGPWEEDVVDGVVDGAVDGGDPSVETGVDPRRPAAARAWVREAAAGWPEDVVEEVLLLLTEVLAADVERVDVDLAHVDRAAVPPAPRRLRLLADGRGVELFLPGPLPDSARPGGGCGSRRGAAGRPPERTPGRCPARQPGSSRPSRPLVVAPSR